MASTFDSVASVAASGVTAASFPHTLGGGSNLVGVFCVQTYTARPISSATYGAQNFAAISGAVRDDSGNGARVDLWGLIAPSGNQTATVNVSGGASDICCGLIVAKDAKQSAPFGTAATAQDETVTVTSATNEISIAMFGEAIGGASTLSTTVGVERFNVTTGAVVTDGAGSTVTGSASAVHTWNGTDSGTFGVSVGVSIKPAPVGDTLMGQACL